MAKRKPVKTTNSKSNSKFLLYLASILAIVALVLTTLLVGYYIGKEGAKEDLQKSVKLERQKRDALIQELEKTTQNIKEQKSINERLQDVLKKESELEKPKEEQKIQEPKTEELKSKVKTEEPVANISASHEIDGEAPEKLQAQKRKRVKSPHKPKLTIIIDDVGTKSQVKAIKSLNLPLVMSFLPPSKGRPATPSLASKESNYMVHLPMEALKFS